MHLISESSQKRPSIIKNEQQFQIIDYEDCNSPPSQQKQNSMFTYSKMTTGKLNNLMQYYSNQDKQYSIKKVNMVKAFINSQLQLPQRNVDSIITKITDSGRGLHSQGKQMNLQSRKQNVSESIIKKFQTQFNGIPQIDYTPQSSTIGKVTGLNSARLEQITKQISKDYGADSYQPHRQTFTSFGRYSSSSKIESAIQPLKQTVFEMKNYELAQRHHNRSFTIKQPSPPRLGQTNRSPYLQISNNSTNNLTATQRELIHTLEPFKIYHNIVTRQAKKRSASTVKVPHQLESPLLTLSHREHSPPKLVLQKCIKPLEIQKAMTVDSNRQRQEKMYQIIQLKLKEKQIITDNQFHYQKQSKILPHMYLNDQEDQKHLNPLQLKNLGRRVLFKKLDRAKSLLNIADQMVVQESDFRRQVQLHQQ